jgi:integrase
VNSLSSVSAHRAGIEKLAPHDLRRTCARLCYLAGGELDQIQFLLGHVSIQTTERYLGCKQKLRCAVNDTSTLRDFWLRMVRRRTSGCERSRLQPGASCSQWA